MADLNKVRGETAWGAWVVAILSVPIALMSYRYLIPGDFGQAPPIVANRFTIVGALTIHAGFAATALLIGPFQFLPGLRRARPRLHRRMGQTYVVCCAVAGASGLLLAFGAQTGPVSTIGFGLLAVSWLAATAQAWRLAVARRFTEHERWMIRSFALTFAAVTLRLYLPLAFISPFGYDDTYRAISFLCWVPNLILAEIYLAGRAPRSSASPAGSSRRSG